MKQIYFDNSATTQVDPQVLEAMLPFLKEDFGNPSSIHSYGQNAMAAVDEARDKIANHLNCKAQEVIFTSGATESNNLAIKGTVNKLLKDNKSIHIITTKIEHPSVLEVYKFLEKRDDVEVSYVNVDADGTIKLEQLEGLIKENTVLISIMYANNEVGSIQPIVEVKKLIVAAKDKRGETGLPLLFHVDAVQAFNYLAVDVDELGVDFLSFSGHKIYGPKGIGGLYIRSGITVDALIHGGHQEYNVRPGTHNVPGMVGLGKAVELVREQQKESFGKMKKIKEKLKKEIGKIDDVRFNGPDEENQLPNIVNVSFLGAEGESILMMFDIEGIAISTGSACSSGSLEPSPILTAMGVKPEWSHGSLRISLGKFNSESEVNVFTKALVIIIDKLRKMAP
jgi:cysteine desulfurase